MRPIGLEDGAVSTQIKKVKERKAGNGSFPPRNSGHKSGSAFDRFAPLWHTGDAE